MNSDFKKYLLDITASINCEEIELIQALWSNYGKISRIQLKGGPIETVVIKCINLNSKTKHPRGWNTNFSHNRKIKSYEVETIWYEKWSRFCTEDCKIPKFIGSFSKEKKRWIILEDLNQHFPLRKNKITLSEIKTCLKWLANFHAIFLNNEPKNLWQIGTYWHLKTRPDEFNQMEYQELKSKAHLIDKKLNQCEFKTILHGDAKLANFCFSKNGKNVAAVDFQYTGGGCGMKDIAYFLGSCLSGQECERYENELLNFYFSELNQKLKSIRPEINFKILEAEWRKMYPYACVDFVRFLLGWMPSHQKINHYNLTMVERVLLDTKP